MNRKTIITFFFIASIYISATNAQDMFQKEYSPGAAAPLVIDTLPDGYLVAGNANSLTAGGLDGFVMKINF